MSYYGVSRIHEPVRVPIGPVHSLGDDDWALGDRQADCTIGKNDYMWSGYSLTRVMGYLLLAEDEARAIMRLAGSTDRFPHLVHTLSDKNDYSRQSKEDVNVARKFWHQKYAKTNLGGQNRLEEIQRGMLHLRNNPCGVKMGGGFFKKITKPLTGIALNLATGGLYSIGKAAVGVAKGKPILKEVKGALASQGIAGGILTPVVGVDKSLAIQAAVAGGALAAGAAATTGTGALALKGGAALLPKAVGALTASSPPVAQATADYPPQPVPELGPSFPQSGPMQASMFGDLSPMTIGLLLGVPLLFHVLTQSKGRR